MTEDGAMEVWRLAHNAPGPIKFSTAAKLLGCKSPFGAGRKIASAGKYLEKSGKLCEAIEVIRSFVDENWGWPWQKQKKGTR